MISLDFYRAVAVFISLALIGIFIAWIFRRRGKDRNLTLDQKFIWYCSICSYTYINTHEEQVTVCPRCGSYNKK